MGHYSSGYTFRGKSKRLEQFLDFIDKCEEYEVTATRKRFICGVLGIKVTKEVPCPVCHYDTMPCDNCGMCWTCCSAVSCERKVLGVRSINGYLSTFFRHAIAHGMIEKVKHGRTWVYIRGPNAEKWEKGEY